MKIAYFKKTECFTRNTSGVYKFVTIYICIYVSGVNLEKKYSIAISTMCSKFCVTVIINKQKSYTALDHLHYFKREKIYKTNIKKLKMNYIF